jgi:hypothetical protein
MKFAGCEKIYDGKLKMQKREAIKDPDVDIPGTAARPRWLGGGLETKLLASATITIARNRIWL